MPRIVGVDVPQQKRIDVALRYIYGVGAHISNQILEKAEVDPATRAKDLTDDQITRISSVITNEFKVEGDLRRQLSQDIRRLGDISSYRGIRHRRSLPVRGQRTHTNARTRKGPKQAVGARKGKK